nr:retrovirus-related Pol polyprotein from transposon TNT 1-94 [Tanacetum cinerariifolium]
MNLFKIGTSRRKSLDKKNVSKQGRNLKTRIKEGDFDDDFDDIDDMMDKAIENVEGDTETGLELKDFSDSDHAGCLDSRKSTSDYGFHFDKIPMYCDSKAAIAISCNPIQHSRTKHIAVKYHFIKEQAEKGIVELFFVGTEYQLADLFTKALAKDRFKYLIRRLGMRCLTLEELEVLANESA